MLWKVEKDTVRQHILDEMYGAALNLSIRIIEVCKIWTAKKFGNLFHLISAIIAAFIPHLKSTMDTFATFYSYKETNMLGHQGKEMND